jgi:predicted aspartyl protease
MKTKLIWPVTVLSLTLFAAETRVQMKDLPPPVQKAVEEQIKTAKLRGLSREVEHGKTYYEAETTVNGKSRDILMDSTGAVVEVEEATAFESIPEAAQRALRTKAGSGKILSVESVTKGSVVSYEAVIQKNGRKSEIAVNSDGSVNK